MLTYDTVSALVDSVLESPPHTMEDCCKSQVMQRCYKEVRDIAQAVRDFDLARMKDHAFKVHPPPLFIGEAGVGKSNLVNLFQELIEGVRKGNYIRVNCSNFASDEQVARTELFGVTSGSSSGGNNQLDGTFHIASNGVLFLNQLEALPVIIQQEIASYLDNCEIKRSGSNRPERVNVLLLLASNITDVRQGITESRFYSDLISRAVTIAVPALRHRSEDIPAIIYLLFREEIIKGYDKQLNFAKTFSKDAIFKLTNHRWDTNLRGVSEILRRLYIKHIQYDINITIEPSHLELPQDDITVSDLAGNSTSNKIGQETDPYIEPVAADFINNDANKQKIKAALILKGGGVKGLALVGALIELEKYYHFTAYVGTSAGAIVAGLLAAGASPERLETILSNTDFRRFRDGRWYFLAKNLLLHFYLHPGREFEKWLWEQVKEYNKQTWQMKPPILRDIKRHLTIYAAQEGEGPLIFDSKSIDGNRNAPLTFAIRCSMSIPIFFKPPMHNGKPVMDGGVLENFPAERWLRDNPGHDFIGVYLGSKVLDPAGSSGPFGPLKNTIIDRNDATFIDLHRERVIVIDPAPIGTTDFELSRAEAAYLVLKGRAEALEHLHRFLNNQHRPSEEEVQAVSRAAALAKDKAINARRRRKWLKVLRIAAVILFIFIFLRYIMPLLHF